MKNENMAYSPTQREMMDTPNIRFVNATMAALIIKNRAPRGLFIQKEKSRFVGINNHTGDALRKTFATKMDCLDWLTESVEEI